MEQSFYNLKFLFQIFSFINFVKLETPIIIERKLSDKIVVSLETKSFDNFCFHPLLIAVVRSCGEANTKLSITELEESFGLFKHDLIRLINKD